VSDSPGLQEAAPQGYADWLAPPHYSAGVACTIDMAQSPHSSLAVTPGVIIDLEHAAWQP